MSFSWFRNLLASRAEAPVAFDSLAEQSFIALEPDLAKELTPHEVSGFMASGSGD